MLRDNIRGAQTGHDLTHVLLMLLLLLLLRALPRPLPAVCCDLVQVCHFVAHG